MFHQQQIDYFFTNSAPWPIQHYPSHQLYADTQQPYYSSPMLFGTVPMFVTPLEQPTPHSFHCMERRPRKNAIPIIHPDTVKIKKIVQLANVGTQTQVSVSTQTDDEVSLVQLADVGTQTQVGVSTQTDDEVSLVHLADVGTQTQVSVSTQTDDEVSLVHLADVGTQTQVSVSTQTDDEVSLTTVIATPNRSQSIIGSESSKDDDPNEHKFVCEGDETEVKAKEELCLIAVKPYLHIKAERRHINNEDIQPPSVYSLVATEPKSRRKNKNKKKNKNRKNITILWSFRVI